MVEIVSKADLHISKKTVNGFQMTVIYPFNEDAFLPAGVPDIPADDEIKTDI